jgi:WD40 repeat protein
MSARLGCLTLFVCLGIGLLDHDAGPGPAHAGGKARGRDKEAHVNGDPEALPPGALFRIGDATLTGAPLALSPDGKLLAAVSRDTVRLLETATARQRARLSGHDGAIAALAFSADGRLLASAGADGTVQLWDPAAGRAVRQLRGHTRAVRAVAFAPDGKLLASAGEDGTLRFWDVASGQPLRQVKVSKQGLFAVAFAPDGKTLATGGGDKTVRLWDVATRTEWRRIEGQRGGVHSLAFSPDGRTLACSTWNRDQSVHLWDVATGRALPAPEGMAHYVGAVAFSPDGKVVAGGGNESVVQLWDAATGKKVRRLSAHLAKEGLVRSVVFSADGKRLATATEAAIRLWDTATWQAQPQFLSPEAGIVTLAFSPDGKSLAAAEGGVIRLRDARTGLGLPEPSSYGVWARSLAFLPDGKSLALGSSAGIRLWDLASGKLSPPLGNDGSSATIPIIALARDGKSLAAVDNVSGLSLWDLTARKEIYRHEDRGAVCVAFSPDGKLLATGNRANVVRLRAAATGRELRRLEAHTNWLRAVTFSPDGRTLAGVDLSGRIVLWEVLTGGVRRASWHHWPRAGGIAFSADGRLLASGGADGAVKLWDVHTGAESRRLAAHGDAVTCVAFSPDGKRLASGSKDRTVLVWDVAALRDGRRPPAPVLAAAAMERLWTALAGEDAARAFEAVCTLAAAPAQAVPFLKGRLSPRVPAEPKRLAGLVRDLGDNRFAVREKATAELARLEELAAPALKEALKKTPPLEVKRRLEKLLARLDPYAVAPEAVRPLRAVEALEWAGTADARQLLQALAGGAPEARLTREARAALARLERRAEARGSETAEVSATDRGASSAPGPRSPRW